MAKEDTAVLEQHPVHYLHELTMAEEVRLERLFNKLDKDGNGRIDIADLSGALKEFGLSSKYAEVNLNLLFGHLFILTVCLLWENVGCSVRWISIFVILLSLYDSHEEKECEEFRLVSVFWLHSICYYFINTDEKQT